MYEPPTKQPATAMGASWTAVAFERKVVTRALYMAVIVGTVLVTINHGMCIYNCKFSLTCLWQSALTYMVPYTVSTVSSVLAMRSHK